MSFSTVSSFKFIYSKSYWQVSFNLRSQKACQAETRSLRSRPALSSLSFSSYHLLTIYCLLHYSWRRTYSIFCFIISFFEFLWGWGCLAVYILITSKPWRVRLSEQDLQSISFSPSSMTKETGGLEQALWQTRFLSQFSLSKCYFNICFDLFMKSYQEVADQLQFSLALSLLFRGWLSACSAFENDFYFWRGVLPLEKSSENNDCAKESWCLECLIWMGEASRASRCRMWVKEAFFSN